MSPCEMPVRHVRAAGLATAASLALILAALGGRASAMPAADTIAVTHTPPVLTSVQGDFRTTVTVTGHCEFAHFLAGASTPVPDLVNMDGFLWDENGTGPGDYSFSFEFQGKLFDPKKPGSAKLEARLYAIVQHDVVLLAEATPAQIMVQGVPEAFTATVDFINRDVVPSGSKWVASGYTVDAQITLTLDPALSQVPLGDIVILAGGFGWSPVPDFPAISGQSIGPVALTGDVTVIPVQFEGSYFDALPCFIVVGCAVDLRPGATDLAMLATGVEMLPLVDY